jgi:hypothetical protein
MIKQRVAYLIFGQGAGRTNGIDELVIDQEPSIRSETNLPLERKADSLKRRRPLPMA